MNTCLICGELTTGSTGSAGLFWARICKPCKASEDGALEARVLALAMLARSEKGASDEQGKTRAG